MAFISMFSGENRGIVNNVLRSRHSMRSLLSYITGPFVGIGTLRSLLSYITGSFVGIGTFHTNVQESKVLARVLDDLGYRVDVVDYFFDGRVDYSDYDLVIGFGEPLERSFESPWKLKRICYMTGANIFFQNPAEIRRVKAVVSARGHHLNVKRVVPWAWTRSTMLSDALVVIGNKWTASTYESFTDIPIYRLNATAILSDTTNKLVRDFEQSRYGFLWFGGAGLIHKGLDLCLEVFTRHPDWTLHICGPKEEDFFAAFKFEFERSNVVFHGLLDATSKTFAQIASSCAFALLPTCSEGQSTALLTAMGTGLIPIATRYSGIDVGMLGLVLQEPNRDELEDKIREAILINPERLQLMSDQVRNYVQRNHSLLAFDAAVHRIFENCLKA